MSESIIVFDMDGVLVDVTGSYRAVISETIHHYTGVTPSSEEIQDWKNRGGYNNDWLLCHHFCREAGVDVDYQALVDYFNASFFGPNDDGLILHEKWIPADGLLGRLAARARLAIFTGRDRRELNATLTRLQLHNQFYPLVTAENVAHGKPAPDGLLLIREEFPGARLVFVGDTVDDARSAAAAQVPFIGIAAPDSPRRDALVAALRHAGALAIIENINQIEGVLPT
ncbi:MAG TPA: HAD-IA family hydrolase [Paludibaculum sp.]|jgi:HAD superfamily phosphatase